MNLARHRFDRPGCDGSEFSPQYGEEWFWSCRIQSYGVDHNCFHGRTCLGKEHHATYTLKDLFASLKKPHVVIIMVKAGAPVDEVIAQLKPYLESGDLMMDGGNSHFQDTERRSKEMEAKGIRYMGVGISGGEEGALWGPSIMPGGPKEAYDLVEPILKSIAAKVNHEPCVTYIGPGGSGHFVKMVHNAIEYGDMQLIAEAYDILHRGLELSEVELHEVFAQWNKGPLSSYLIEITANIFTCIDDKNEKTLGRYDSGPS